MATTPLQGWTVPGGSDAPANAAAFASLGAAVEKQVVMRFATTTARDALITSGNRKAGMTAFIDALGYRTQVLVDAGAWVKDTTDVFVGSEGIVIGTQPPAGTPKVRKEGTWVGATSGAGGIAFNYAGGAFANGIQSVVAVAGDTAAGLGFITPIVANLTLAAWNGIAYQPGGAAVSSAITIRVNYAVVGW